MSLNPAFIRVAERLQEAAIKMCHADIRSRISDAISDASKGTGTYCYVANIFGDDKSGTVVYSCGYGDDLKQCAYTIDGANCTVDMAAAVDVQPFTTYQVVTMGGDLTEAGARNSKRDMAQLQAIHDASSKLGAACKMTEAAKTKGLRLVESATTLETIALREAKSDYEIKLIAPGKGASAFYPAEVLKRDGPGVFKSGTHVYLNHPTLAEEAARPEGDVKNLAGVLTTGASYHESHAKGPGLYARMKVFADHATTVEEKAPHVGMSIRASGVQEAGKLRDGVPVLKQLTSAESVDVVTRAGAGGMILTESARTDPATPAVQIPATEGQVDTMQAAALDEAAVTKLIEAAVLAATGPLKARALRGDAQILATRLLSPVTLSEGQKLYIITQVMRGELPLKEGALDEAKFGELLIAEAKQYATTLGTGAQVHGMGIGLVETPNPGRRKRGTLPDDDDDDAEDLREARALKAAKTEDAEFVELFESAFGMNKVQAAAAAKGRAA